MTNNRIELLAPAGNYEKFKTALYYGADAVYLSGKAFGLRAFAGNFTDEEIKLACNEAHSLGIIMPIVIVTVISGQI